MPTERGKAPVADTEPASAALKAARPLGPEGIRRELGLGQVLAAVVGEARPPPRVGRFVVERRCGEGGMGVVFRGRDETTGAPVAIKLLERATDEMKDRFEREVALLRQLDHPRIVRYLDHGITGEGQRYLVMEWLEGHDLAARVAGGPLPVAEALRAAIAGASGLAGAHAAGVVHRDVKPSNLFLVHDRIDDIRVIDFGIARASRSERLTATGALLGTPGYMAPEQIRGEHETRSDVYGLGVTLFELLTGRLPFSGASPGALLVAVMAEPAPSVRALRADVPPALDACLGRLLAKDPRDRPSSMADVEAELGDLLAERRAISLPAPGLSLAERRPPARDGHPHAAPLVTKSSEAHTSVIAGRARERGLLRGMLDECIEERAASAAVIVGAAGIGKTTLLDAFTAEAARAAPSAVLIRARGDADRRGVAFGLLAALVGAAGERLACAERDHVASLLARVAGHRIAASGAPLAADASAGAPGAAPWAHDPSILADTLRIAWFDLVEAWALRAPLVWIVDDAHLADLVSLRFLARAAEQLAETPGLIVLAACPGRALSELSALFGAITPVQITLPPMRPRVLRALAARWAPGESEERLDDLVQRAGGNPFHLREIVRAAREGDAASGSAADLAWARIERLDPESRRILRAASIAGRRVALSALGALLGSDPSSPAVAPRIAQLEAAGLLRRATSSADGDPMFEIDSELTRLAAYHLSTPEDLARGHLAMAEWLAGRTDASAAIVAHHLCEAGERDRAAHWFARAARGALAGEDAELTERLVRSGLAHAKDPALRGELHAIAAESAYWRSDVARSFEMAKAATADDLPRGTAGWFRVLSVAITSAGQLGNNDVVAKLLDEVLSTTPAGEAGASDARAVCIARAIGQLASMEARLGARGREILEASVTREQSGALARAWVHRARGATRIASDFDGTIDAWLRAHEAYVEAGDRRSAAVLQLSLGSVYVWTGAWARAGEVIIDAHRIARALGSRYLEVWALYVRGKLLSETAPLADASRALSAVIESADQSPRIRAGACVYLSLAAARAGAFDTAADIAQRARDTEDARAVRLPVTAALARAHLLRGATAEACALEPELARGATETVIEFDELVKLAASEVARARGDETAARDAIARARASLTSRAATLSSPVRRGEYLHGPHLNVRTLELAAAWLDEA